MNVLASDDQTTDLTASSCCPSTVAVLVARSHLDRRVEVEDAGEGRAGRVKEMQGQLELNSPSFPRSASTQLSAQHHRPFHASSWS